MPKRTKTHALSPLDADSGQRLSLKGNLKTDGRSASIKKTEAAVQSRESSPPKSTSELSDISQIDQEVDPWDDEPPTRRGGDYTSIGFNFN